MAEKKTIELEITSNLADAEKSLGSLKSQLRNAQAEVASLSDKFGATSKEAVNAAKNAAILADKIGDAKALTDAFNPDAKFKALSGSLNGIAGGFSVVTGVMGTLGTESKDVEQAILKVQSAMAIASGAQAIGESVDQFRQLGAVVKSYAIVQKAITAGQWLWNAAMAANPIGLLVAGVAALVAGGVALTNYFMSNAEAAKINTASINANKTALNNQSKTADSASKSLQTNSEYQLAMAKASGASTDAIRKLELKLIDEKIAFANSSREIAKNTYHKNLNALASLKAADADEEQIKAQEEITRKSLEEFGKQTKNLNDANAEKGNIIRRQNVEIRQEQTNHNNEVKNKNKEASTKANEDAITAEKERQDLISKQGESARDKYEAAEKLIKDTKKANEDALKTENQIKVEKENADFELKKQSLIEKGLSIEEIEKEHKRNLSIITKTENDKILADAKEQADKEIALDLAIKEAKRNALNVGLDILQQFAGKNKAIALGILAVTKGLAIADIIVGASKTIAGASAATGLANSAALATPQAIATSGASAIPVIAGNVSILGKTLALTKLTAATSIASIVAAGISGAKSITGGSAGGGSGGSGGGGGTAPSPAAPAFNVVGASPTNQLAQTIGNQQQQPIKAYVVSNDVTTAQSLDRNIISSASIG